MTGQPSQRVDLVNRANVAVGPSGQQPRGPHLSGQVSTGDRSCSGEPPAAAASPELAGNGLQGVSGPGVWRVRLRAVSRFQWRWLRGLPWPELAPATTAGGGRIGSSAKTAIRARSNRMDGPGGIYARVRVQRARTRDHLVAGWLPATSSRGGGLGHDGHGVYGHGDGQGRGEDGAAAHRSSAEVQGVLGEGLVQAVRRR